MRQKRKWVVGSVENFEEFKNVKSVTSKYDSFEIGAEIESSYQTEKVAAVRMVVAGPANAFVSIPASPLRSTKRRNLQQHA